MDKVALISKNPIVSKIFTLVLKKLSFELNVYENDNIETQFLYIIVDDEVEVDTNKITLLSNKLILLSNSNNIKQEYSFFIKKPFLPSSLQKELETILYESSDNQTRNEPESKENIHERDEIKTQNMENLNKLVDNVLDGLDDIESEDDLVIDKSTLSHGGVLDQVELSKLNSILHEQKNVLIDDENQDEWIELSQIIDKAIDDFEAVEFSAIKPINLLINKNNLNELKPLLKKLNQEIIDSLVDGKEITIKLRLENR
ncbi:MAG TPA: hypothetical protein ENK66_05695 [Arcobacter sp.]|nr:hypothetical protein [Arcobacter sp.]